VHLWANSAHLRHDGCDLSQSGLRQGVQDRVPDPGEVRRYAVDAVAVDAAEVGLDEAVGNYGGVGLLDAVPVEDGLDKGPGIVGPDENGRGLGSGIHSGEGGQDAW